MSKLGPVDLNSTNIIGSEKEELDLQLRAVPDIEARIAELSAA